MWNSKDIVYGFLACAVILLVVAGLFSAIGCKECADMVLKRIEEMMTINF